MLGRRGVLAGALGIAALSACDVDDLRPPEDETAAPTPSVSSGSASATPEPDADTVLAENAAIDISDALVLVDHARRTFPRLRGPLKHLARMHRAHLEVLVPPSDLEIPAPAPVATPAEALARLRTTEDTLQRSLAAAAVSAQSGALARLLASVSASVAQHTYVSLPAPPVEGGPR